MQICNLISPWTTLRPYVKQETMDIEVSIRNASRLRRFDYSTRSITQAVENLTSQNKIIFLNIKIKLEQTRGTLKKVRF